MSKPRTFLRAFSGGEMSPEMYSRIDDARFQTGAAKIRNMVVNPQGTVTRRGGLEFVAKTKDSTKRTRVIPFTYSADQALAIGITEGAFRFHADGGTLLAASTDFVLTKLLSGVNGTAEVMQFNFSAAHGLATGDAINLTYGIGGAIGPLLLYTTYYAIYVDATHIQVAASREDALAGTFLDLTGTWTSVYVSRVYTAGEAVGYPTAGSAGYVCQVESRTGTTPLAQVPVTCGAPIGTPGVVTATNHGYFHGTKIVFALNGGTLPAELTAGVIYYAIPLTANTFNVATTYGGAAIAFTTASTGSPTTARAALWASAVEYEIPNPYLEEDIFDINFAQSNDVVTLTHNNYPPAELRRLGPTHWTYTEIDFEPPIATPVIGTPTVVFGESMDVSAVSIAATAVLTTISQPGLQINDVVYLTGTVGDIPPNTFYRVRTVAASGGPYDIELSTMDGGQPIGSGSSTVSGGKLRYVNASTETSNDYVVTAVTALGAETGPSASYNIVNNLNVSASYNVLTWGVVAGADRYRIYKKRAGLYGFIGEVAAPLLTFTDENLAPDIGRTPPIRDDSLSGNDYPAAVTYFEQRRVFGGLRSQPQDVWATQSGTESDLSYHIPIVDSDRIQFRVASLQRCAIRHIVPLDQLMLLTSSVEFRVTPVNSDAITPTSVSARAQSYIGASPVRPVVVGNSLVFAADRGGHLYQYGFSQEAGGFIPADISIRATHLFDNLEVEDMTNAKAPTPILWAVSSNGKALGLTYVPSEQIGAWHQHDTDGIVESVAAVSEGTVDSLYVVVKRTIGDGMGGTVDMRYIERMRLLEVEDIDDVFYVDSGLTYSGAAATLISGLDHLEGKTVVALADGVVRRDLLVTGGTVTLPVAASLVQVGLPFTSELQTLPLTLQRADGFGTGHMKNINRAYVRVFKSARFKVGATADLLSESDEIDEGELVTTMVRVPIRGEWTEDGQVFVQQADPVPLTIVGLTLESSVGG